MSSLICSRIVLCPLISAAREPSCLSVRHCWVSNLLVCSLCIWMSCDSIPTIWCCATQGRFLSHLEQWEQLLSLCDRNMYMWRGHANNGQINFPIFTTRNKQSTNFPEFVWIGSWNNLLTQRQPQDCLLTPDWTKLTASTKCTSNAWIFYWMCTHIGETLGNKLVQTHAIIK